MAKSIRRKITSKKRRKINLKSRRKINLKSRRKINLKSRLDGGKKKEELFTLIKTNDLYDLLYHHDFKNKYGFERVELTDYLADESSDIEIPINFYDEDNQLTGQIGDLNILKHFNLGNQQYFRNHEKSLYIFINNGRVKIVPIDPIEDKKISSMKIWIDANNKKKILTDIEFAEVSKMNVDDVFYLVENKVIKEMMFTKSDSVGRFKIQSSRLYDLDLFLVPITADDQLIIAGKMGIRVIIRNSQKFITNKDFMSMMMKNPKISLDPGAAKIGFTEDSQNLIYIDYDFDNKETNNTILVKKSFFHYYKNIFPNDKRFDKRGLFFLNSTNRMSELIDNFILNQDKFKINNSIYKYQYCNYLDFDEKITYGFFDPGEQTDFFSSSIETFKFQRGRREIIFCDEGLREVIKIMISAINFSKENDIKFPKENDIEVDFIRIAIATLNLYIESSKTNKITYKKPQPEWEEENNIANLSNIKEGVCRHKSILLKFIIDNINDIEKELDKKLVEKLGLKTLKCSLERGTCFVGGKEGKHIWCTISFLNKIFIIDPRNSKELLTVKQFEKMFEFSISSFSKTDLSKTVGFRRGG